MDTSWSKDLLSGFLLVLSLYFGCRALYHVFGSFYASLDVNDKDNARRYGYQAVFVWLILVMLGLINWHTTAGLVIQFWATTGIIGLLSCLACLTARKMKND